MKTNKEYREKLTKRFLDCNFDGFMLKKSDYIFLSKITNFKDILEKYDTNKFKFRECSGFLDTSFNIYLIDGNNKDNYYDSHTLPVEYHTINDKIYELYPITEDELDNIINEQNKSEKPIDYAISNTNKYKKKPWIEILETDEQYFDWYINYTDNKILQAYLLLRVKPLAKNIPKDFSIITFGKYLHKSWLDIIEVDMEYVKWVIRKTNDDKLKDYLNNILKEKDILV